MYIKPALTFRTYSLLITHYAPHMSSTEATPENTIVLDNFGGQQQHCIETALELANALELDNALWMKLV